MFLGVAQLPDPEGYELAVLKGAERALQDALVVHTEASRATETGSVGWRVLRETIITRHVSGNAWLKNGNHAEGWTAPSNLRARLEVWVG